MAAKETTILDSIKWNNYPPSPPKQWWRREGARHAPFWHHWNGGRGGPDVPFILSKIVGWEGPCGRVVRKPVNVNPGLNVNSSIIFSCLKMFFTSNVWCSLRYRRANNVNRTPPLGWGPDPALARIVRRLWNKDHQIAKTQLWVAFGSFQRVDVVQIGSRTEKMFPSHLSVNDLGVFAVVMVFGLIVVLLFMFDFVSTVSLVKKFRVFIRDGVQCVLVRIILFGENRVFIPSN